MVKRGPHPQSPKSYSPSEGMKEFISEKLQLLKKEKSSTEWNTRKARTLDKLFQTTADLIYFLEQIADKPELQEVFEDDLREFFESKRDSDTRQLSPLFGVEHGGIRIQETMLSRLVFAALIPHEDDYDNFRVKLLHGVQSIVYVKMWWMLTKSFSPSDIVVKSALEDLEKAMGWTLFQSKSIHDYIQEPKRYFDFHAPYKATLRTKKK